MPKKAPRTQGDKDFTKARKKRPVDDGYCEWADKVSFDTEARARKYVRWHQRYAWGWKARHIYQCPNADHWHLTTQPPIRNKP